MTLNSILQSNDNKNNTNQNLDRFKRPSIQISEPTFNQTNNRHVQLSVMSPPQEMRSSIQSKRTPIKRNKVKLKPGHSPLDWNYLVATKGIKGELITGLEQLRLDPDLPSINRITSINQLNHRIPTYQIKPSLRINKHILQKHQTWLGEEDSNNDYWCNIGGKIYSLTSYLEFHPGGIDIILGLKDKDLLPQFNKHHRWVSYEKLLQTCLVGVFVDE